MGGQKAIDAWRRSRGAWSQRQIRLEEGEHSIVVEYLQKSVNTNVYVGWELLGSE